MIACYMQKNLFNPATHTHTPYVSVFLFLSRAEKQQEDTDDYTHYEEDKKQYHTDFTLPCPYLSGRRHHGLSNPARVLSPVLEVEMRQIKEEVGGKRKSVRVF